MDWTEGTAAFAGAPERVVPAPSSCAPKGATAVDEPIASEQSRDGSPTQARPDLLYLFALRLEWRDQRDLKAYGQLVAALDHPEEDIRVVAEELLYRASPRPRGKGNPNRRKAA